MWYSGRHRVPIRHCHTVPTSCGTVCVIECPYVTVIQFPLHVVQFASWSAHIRNLVAVLRSCWGASKIWTATKFSGMWNFIKNFIRNFCEISSEIIECIIFAPYELSITTIDSMVWPTKIQNWGIDLYKPMEQPVWRAVIAWLLHRNIEVNFLKLMDSNQIFRNGFVCLYYHLCKILSQINECKIFSPNDFLQWTFYNTIYSMVILNDTGFSLCLPIYNLHSSTVELI